MVLKISSLHSKVPKSSKGIIKISNLRCNCAHLLSHYISQYKHWIEMHDINLNLAFQRSVKYTNKSLKPTWISASLGFGAVCMLSLIVVCKGLPMLPSYLELWLQYICILKWTCILQLSLCKTSCVLDILHLEYN